MATKIRITCPACGMMVDEERLRSGPHRVKVFLQIMGGKVPETGAKHRGKAPGLMKYKDITKSKEGKEILRRVENG